MIESVRWGGGALQVFIGCVPNAHYIHCYAHQLSWSSNRPPLTFLKGKNIFRPCWALQRFSPRSPKCIVLDKILTHTPPTSGNDRLNLYSWAINTMFENIYCFENIVTQVTLTPVPSEMMKPWPCCWIIRTYFWNLLSHHATCGPPLCQVPWEEHFIIIAFPLFYYYILVIPSVNKSVALCHQERLQVLILEDHPRVADKIYVCCLS